MSEIRATTISDLVGTGPVTLTGQEAIKHWVNYDSITPTVTDSFNTSSVTDVAQGQATPNLTNAMDNTTYCGLSSHAQTTSGYSPRNVNFGNNQDAGTLDANFTTSSYSVNIQYGYNGAEYDVDFCYLALLGDLA